MFRDLFRSSSLHEIHKENIGVPDQDYVDDRVIRVLDREVWRHTVNAFDVPIHRPIRREIIFDIAARTYKVLTAYTAERGAMEAGQDMDWDLVMSNNQTRFEAIEDAWDTMDEEELESELDIHEETEDFPVDGE